MRALAQSLAREFGPKGLHVAHAIIDGVIDIERTKDWKFDHPDAKISPHAVRLFLVWNPDLGGSTGTLLSNAADLLLPPSRLRIHTGTFTLSQGHVLLMSSTFGHTLRSGRSAAPVTHATLPAIWRKTKPMCGPRGQQYTSRMVGGSRYHPGNT